MTAASGRREGTGTRLGVLHLATVITTGADHCQLIAHGDCIDGQNLTFFPQAHWISAQQPDGFRVCQEPEKEMELISEF